MFDFINKNFNSTNLKNIFIFSLLIHTFFSNPTKTKPNVEYKNNLEWEIIPEKLKNSNEKLIWSRKVPTKFINELNVRNQSTSKFIEVRSLGKALTVNEILYPEISNYVPNAYVQDNNKNLNLSLRGISKVRHCNSSNFSYACLDGIIDIDYSLINKDKFSLNSKLTIQSLTNRNSNKNGTKYGEASSIGFKVAKRINHKSSLSFGGDNLIHLDNKSDLGRNFYFIYSSYYPLNLKEEPSILFINAGVGSDFYGYKGNGFIARTKCFGTPNLTGNGENTCTWGPIGSITLAFNSQIAVINEWFGYGYGLGLAVRPFKDKPINLSFYATDFIKNFPQYNQDSCPNNSCDIRFYGGISYSF